MEGTNHSHSQPCERSWLLKNVKGATGLLVMVSDSIDVELLDAAGDQLKVVATLTAGTNHINLEALKKRNIRLGYITDCLSNAVADLTVMLVLMAQRRAGKAMLKVSRGEWPQSPWHPGLMTGPQIRGATVGFVGFGRIVQATLKRLVAFEVKRAIYTMSRPGKPASADYYGLIRKSTKGSAIPVEVAWDLSQLANESNVVIVGCWLMPSTLHLITSNFFNKMKKTAVIANIARGPVTERGSYGE